MREFACISKQNIWNIFESWRLSGEGWSELSNNSSWFFFFFGCPLFHVYSSPKIFGSYNTLHTGTCRCLNEDFSFSFFFCPLNHLCDGWHQNHNLKTFKRSCGVTYPSDQTYRQLKKVPWHELHFNDTMTHRLGWFQAMPTMKKMPNFASTNIFHVQWHFKTI